MEGINSNGTISEEAKENVNKILRQQFRPEFLNRLDEIVFYKPLEKKEIYKIVDLMLEDLQKRLRDKQLKIELSDKAKNHIVEEGYNPVYGARPLKRFMQSKLETLIAKIIIKGDIKQGDNLIVDYDGDKMVVKERND